MNTKTKIIVPILVLIALALGGIVFLIFFFPDEKLQDQSDLLPSLGNISKTDNAYFAFETARKNYQKPSIEPADFMLYLTGKTPKAKIQDSDIDSFLTSEQASITQLEQAEQLPSYENPIAGNYKTLDIVNVLPINNPSTTNLFRILYVKGLYELKTGQPTEGLQTIKDAMKLAAKMRKGSLSMIEYLIQHASLVMGKNTLNYFAENSAVTPTEVKDFTQQLKDNNWQDYINATKFEFQIDQNMLGEVTKNGNFFTLNHFNFQKNATLNQMAGFERNIITATKTLDCKKSKATSTDLPASDWTYIFKKNGVGQAFLNAFTWTSPSQIFCKEDQQL